MQILDPGWLVAFPARINGQRGAKAQPAAPHMCTAHWSKMHGLKLSHEAHPCIARDTTGSAADRPPASELDILSLVISRMESPSPTLDAGVSESCLPWKPASVELAALASLQCIVFWQPSSGREAFCFKAELCQGQTDANRQSKERMLYLLPLEASELLPLSNRAPH